MTGLEGGQELAPKPQQVLLVVHARHDAARRLRRPAENLSGLRSFARLIGRARFGDTVRQ
jgi:hypothetical protein